MDYIDFEYIANQVEQQLEKSSQARNFLELDYLPQGAILKIDNPADNEIFYIKDKYGEVSKFVSHDYDIDFTLPPVVAKGSPILFKCSKTTAIIPTFHISCEVEIEEDNSKGIISNIFSNIMKQENDYFSRLMDAAGYPPVVEKDNKYGTMFFRQKITVYPISDNQIVAYEEVAFVTERAGMNLNK